MASRHKPLAAFVWGLLWFSVMQLAMSLAIHSAFPQWRDPEFAIKMQRLRICQAENSGRPLVVVLGSSRAGLGIRPDVLDFGKDAPLVFNYAFTGAGPVMELVCLHRLLRHGVRPDRLIVEIHPALLNLDDHSGEEVWLNPVRLSWQDLLVWQPYLSRPAMHWRRWLLGLLLPAYVHRFPLLSSLAPSWLPWDDKVRLDGWRQLDRFGWMPYPKSTVTAEEYREGLEFAWAQYRAGLQNYRVTPKAERALRELLAICQREKIPVTLLTMPEGTVFRSWYSPDGHTKLVAFLQQLSQEYDALWIDARDWADDDHFFDNHHLLSQGAAVFMRRLGPWLSTSNAKPWTMAESCGTSADGQ